MDVESKELTRWNNAKYWIAEAHTIDEVKQIRDKAEALRQYIKQQGEGLEAQNQIAEVNHPIASYGA